MFQLCCISEQRPPALSFEAQRGQLPRNVSASVDSDPIGAYFDLGGDGVAVNDHLLMASVRPKVFFTMEMTLLPGGNQRLTSKISKAPSVISNQIKKRNKLE